MITSLEYADPVIVLKVTIQELQLLRMCVGRTSIYDINNEYPDFFEKVGVVLLDNTYDTLTEVLSSITEK
jgi:hypothetical protein